MYRLAEMALCPNKVCLIVSKKAWELELVSDVLSSGLLAEPLVISRLGLEIWMC